MDFKYFVPALVLELPPKIDSQNLRTFEIYAPVRRDSQISFLLLYKIIKSAIFICQSIAFSSIFKKQYFFHGINFSLPDIKNVAFSKQSSSSPQAAFRNPLDMSGYFHSTAFDTERLISLVISEIGISFYCCLRYTRRFSCAYLCLALKKNSNKESKFLKVDESHPSQLTTLRFRPAKLGCDWLNNLLALLLEYCFNSSYVHTFWDAVRSFLVRPFSYVQALPR